MFQFHLGFVPSEETHEYLRHLRSMLRPDVRRVAVTHGTGTALALKGASAIASAGTLLAL